MSRKLYNSLKAQKDQTEQVKLVIYGSLGIPLNGRKVIQVADRQGYVYVRLRDNQNEVIQAFNNKVAASYDLPVIVVREGGRYVIQQYNSQRYLNNAQNSAPFLPGHGTQHSFPRGGGADITWVYGQQIMPALVYPEAITGTNVMVEKYPLLNPNGRWIYAGGTGTQNILQYLPTTGSSSLMALVYLDAITGNPGVLVGSGTYFPANITGSVYPYLPSPSSTQIPLAGVLLNTGTQSIGWENLYDVRQWVHATPSGTSSGGGGGGGIDTIGFAGLAAGVPIGTGTFLNVVGAGATFTRSGTMFNLDIPGGGGTAPVTGSMVIQNNGINLGSATILNFTSGITASISGSVAQISVTGTATYVRTAPPLSLSSVTGAYWVTQERIYASGSLAVFNQGHALIPAIDYIEQYPISGTFQYLNVPPTGTFQLAIYGIPVAGGSGGGGGGSSVSVQDEGVLVGTPSILNFTGNYVNTSISGTVANIRIPASQNDVPASIRGLQIWLRSDYFSGFSDNQIVTGTWQDWSGLENDASAIGSPTIKTNQINGYPSVLLNGSTQYFFIKAPASNPTVCFVAVFNLNSIAPAYTGIIGYDAFTDRGGYFVKSNGKSAEYFGSNNYDGTGAATFVTGTWNYISTNHKPTLSDTRRNGAADGTATTSAVIASAPVIYLGNQIVGGRFMSGNLVEFMGFGRYLNASEISTLETYIQNRYGI